MLRQKTKTEEKMSKVYTFGASSLYSTFKRCKKEAMKVCKEIKGDVEIHCNWCSGAYVYEEVCGYYMYKNGNPVYKKTNL